jgi:outer membrane protein TolC
VAALALLGSGCVTAPLARDVTEMRDVLTLQRQPALAAALPDAGAWKAADIEVERLLGEPLTAETVVRIAMLNNRELRAALHGLGVAQGNLVQASLPPNPEVELELRKPTGGSGEPLQADVGLEYSLSDLLLLPLRRGVAEAERDAERLRVAGEVLDVAYRTRLAFQEVQARQQHLELRQRAFQVAQAGYETAVELHRVGNLAELDLARQRTEVEAARIGVAETEGALLDAREQLNVALGLYGPRTQWRIGARLAEPEADLGMLEGLEGRAVEANLELAQLRHRAEAAARSLTLARTEGFLPHISGGFHGERDGAHWELGAHLELSLPVFDRKQGRRMASASELAALEQRHEATATAVRASLRTARNRLESTARRARHYRDVLLPARERALKELLLQYNAMHAGVFQVLQAQRDLTEAAGAYVDTLLEHGRARAAFEQILAGRHQGVSLGAMASSGTQGPRASAVADAH